MTGMNFGQALQKLKEGYRCTRKGWNGKGMYVYYVEGRKIPITQWVIHQPSETPTPDEIEKGYVEILPHLDMCTVNSTGRRARLCGWLASQTDMISDDWEVVLD